MPVSFSGGIICVLYRGSFAVRDHLRYNLGIITGLGIICGRGSFAALYKASSYEPYGYSNRDLGKRAGNFAIRTLHPGYREENNTMHFRDRTDITELLILFSSIMKPGMVLFDS